MNTRTIFEDNSVSDTDILSDDPDFDTNEYNRMQAFFRDHMGNKSHPDRYVACMHAYSKLRRSEMNDDVESMELDEDEEQDGMLLDSNPSDYSKLEKLSCNEFPEPIYNETLNSIHHHTFGDGKPRDSHQTTDSTLRKKDLG